MWNRNGLHNTELSHLIGYHTHTNNNMMSNSDTIKKTESDVHVHAYPFLLIKQMKCHVRLYFLWNTFLPICFNNILF